jgi:hypothetical protein
MPSNSSTNIPIMAAAVLSISMLGGCRAQEQQEPASENQVAAEKPRQRLPIVEPPFNRSRLLLTVARAASAHSAGLDDSAVQRMLDGKQFEVRLRFGCDGQGPKEDHGWSVDPDGRTLRLRVVPTLSLDDDVSRTVASEGVEAVEGFWLKRPWVLQAACPVRTVAAGTESRQDEDEDEEKDDRPSELPAKPSPVVQRIGIAQFFVAEDSRTRQRTGRPFEAVRQLEEGERVGEQGFDLVLAGRFRARNDGRVILCTGSGRDRPPDCIVSAAVDRVRIENPEDKRVMAEWSV